VKNKLRELSKRLKALHKQFLENERYVAEKNLERKLAPLEFFHLLTQDPNFAWLQPFSGAIADLDAFVDESEQVLVSDLVDMREQIDFVLGEANPYLSERCEHWLNHDPDFVLLYASLKESLRDLVVGDVAKPHEASENSDDLDASDFDRNRDLDPNDHEV